MKKPNLNTNSCISRLVGNRGLKSFIFCLSLSFSMVADTFAAGSDYAAEREYTACKTSLLRDSAEIQSPSLSPSYNSGLLLASAGAGKSTRKTCKSRSSSKSRARRVGRKSSAAKKKSTASRRARNVIPSRFGVLVENRDGSLVREELSNSSFNPASAIKLLTAYGSLREFGPDHRFITELRLSPDGTLDQASGTYTGDVYLSGKDPDFHRADAENLIRLLSDAGIKKIDGRLIIEPGFSFSHSPDSMASGRALARVWKSGIWHESKLASNIARKALQCDKMSFTLLSYLEHNAQRDGVALLLEPTAPLMSLTARVLPRTLESSNFNPIDSISLSLDAESKLCGSAGVDSQHIQLADAKLSQPEPVRSKRCHIEIDISGGLTLGTSGSECKPIVSHRSEPLKRTLKVMLSRSLNASAERIGYVAGGTKKLEELARSAAGDLPGEIRLASSSGLGVNRMTPRQMMRILRLLGEELKSEGLDFHDIMPVAGVDFGTLARRFTAETERGSVVAKTGTLITTDGGASALVGMLRSKQEDLYFVLFGQSGHVPSFRARQDRIVRSLQDERGGPQPLGYPGMIPAVEEAKSQPVGADAESET